MWLLHMFLFIVRQTNDDDDDDVFTRYLKILVLHARIGRKSARLVRAAAMKLSQELYTMIDRPSFTVQIRNLQGWVLNEKSRYSINTMYDLWSVDLIVSLKLSHLTLPKLSQTIPIYPALSYPILSYPSLLPSLV